MNTLENNLKDKKFKNVYLFYGEEDYLKKEYKDKLKSVIVPEHSEMMNFDEFEGEDIDINSVIDAAQTIPFLNEYRLICLKNSKLFQSGKKDATYKLADFIPQIPVSTIIIFIEEKIDKKVKLYKTVNKLGHCVEFKFPSEAQVISLISKNLKKEGLIISNATAAYFCRYTSADLNLITNECKKLAVYKSTNEEITVDDINSVCSKALETEIFELVEAIGLKDCKKALNIYNNMLLMKQSPIMILTMIARQLRLILQCKYSFKENNNYFQVAQDLSMRDFMVKRFVEQGRNFTYSELIEAIKDCLECDVKIKTGLISDKTGVEIVIIKYSSK